MSLEAITEMVDKLLWGWPMIILLLGRLLYSGDFDSYLKCLIRQHKNG